MNKYIFTCSWFSLNICLTNLFANESVFLMNMFMNKRIIHVLYVYIFSRFRIFMSNFYNVLLKNCQNIHVSYRTLLTMNLYHYHPTPGLFHLTSITCRFQGRVASFRKDELEFFSNHRHKSRLKKIMHLRTNWSSFPKGPSIWAISKNMEDVFPAIVTDLAMDIFG